MRCWLHRRMPAERIGCQNVGHAQANRPCPDALTYPAMACVSPCDMQDWYSRPAAAASSAAPAESTLPEGDLPRITWLTRNTVLSAIEPRIEVGSTAQSVVMHATAAMKATKGSELVAAPRTRANTSALVASVSSLAVGMLPVAALLAEAMQLAGPRGSRLTDCRCLQSRVLVLTQRDGLRL